VFPVHRQKEERTVSVRAGSVRAEGGQEWSLLASQAEEEGAVQAAGKAACGVQETQAAGVCGRWAGTGGVHR